MRVYLDNCAFNRLFDDISQERVRIEAIAVTALLERVQDGVIDLVWSSMVDFENSDSPIQEQKDWIFSLKDHAIIEVEATINVHDKSESLIEYGLKSKDALHVASAMAGQADYFVTTDDGILRRRDQIDSISILNPVELVKIIGHENEHGI